MAEEEGVVPSEGIGQGSTGGTGSALSFLNGEFINEHMMNVFERVSAIVDRLFDRGLLASGYLPFEMPVSDEMLQKMTPEQFRQFYDTQPSLNAKAILLARMSNLKLPYRELLPREPQLLNPKQTMAQAGPAGGNRSAVVSSEAGATGIG